MAELSKTAKASMVRETPKEVRVETTEEAIRQIRLSLEAKLYITPDRIAKLVAAYDTEKYAVRELGPACAGLLKRAETAEEKARNLEGLVGPVQDENRSLKFRLQSLLYGVVMEEETAKIVAEAKARGATVTQVQDEIIIEEPNVVMKHSELDHPAEDEHHLVDFGHHTVHSKSEGA